MTDEVVLNEGISTIWFIWQYYFFTNKGMKLFFYLVTSPCVVLLMVSNVYAERCATPEEVRDRLVSTDYEWSVNEDVSLDGLLSVTQLYGVSIENYGEFVACKYEAAQQYIRLDGTPKNSKCPVRAISDNWFISESGQTVCDEEDNTLCHFEFGC